MARIGFIGLGNMGGPMARNLIKAGHELKVFDLSEEAVNYLVQSGAQAAGSVKEAAGGVDYIVTMLPVGDNVREVFLADGVVAAADPGTVLIDSSTIDVESARAVHDAANKSGFAMLDAPVSGGVTGADAATLTFMCGGDEAAFRQARPVLEDMGKTIIHCGGPGLGQVTKICNNMLAGVHALVAAEAMVMGERLGVDRATLYEVIAASTGRSYMFQASNPMPNVVATSPASNAYKPGFMARLMLKDLRLSQAASAMAGSPTPLGAAATAAFQTLVDQGFGEHDTASIVHVIDPSVV